MAWSDDTDIWYYDSDTNSTATTGTTTYYGKVPVSTTASATDNTYVWYSYEPVCREIYVECPERWSDEDAEQYALMVNATKTTGGRVTALIKGKVCIMDPNIETRTLANFLPLLKERANASDRKSIDDFMAAHPLK